MKRFLFQEADFYGASRLIFGSKRLPVCYRSSWMHGLGYAFKENYNKNVLLHYDERRLPIHLVHNNETVDCLRSEGISAISVGAPYVYTKKFLNQERGRTIYKRLYMPAHSIGGNNQKSEHNRWRKIISKYKCDAICLSAQDHKHVLDSNINFGDVSVIRGATPSDHTSLERMATLFFSTQEVMTDMIGSHMIYAAASGANVQVISEISENYKSSGNSEKLLNSIPKKVRADYKEYYKDKETNLSNLLSSIWLTGNHSEIKEYSEFLLGVGCRKDVDTVREYLTPVSEVQKIKIISSILLEKAHSKIGMW